MSEAVNKDHRRRLIQVASMRQHFLVSADRTAETAPHESERAIARAMAATLRSRPSMSPSKRMWGVLGRVESGQRCAVCQASALYMFGGYAACQRHKDVAVERSHRNHRIALDVVGEYIGARHKSFDYRQLAGPTVKRGNNLTGKI